MGQLTTNRRISRWSMQPTLAGKSAAVPGSLANFDELAFCGQEATTRNVYQVLSKCWSCFVRTYALFDWDQSLQIFACPHTPRTLTCTHGTLCGAPTLQDRTNPQHEMTHANLVSSDKEIVGCSPNYDSFKGWFMMNIYRWSHDRS